MTRIVSHKLLDGNIVVETSNGQTLTVTKGDYDGAPSTDLNNPALKIIQEIPVNWDETSKTMYVGRGKPPVVKPDNICSQCGRVP